MTFGRLNALKNISGGAFSFSTWGTFLTKGKPPFELISSDPCINLIIDNLVGEWNYGVFDLFFRKLLHGFRSTINRKGSPMGFWNFITGGIANRCKANKIIKNAKSREENARNALETQKSNTQESLSILGTAKQDAFTNAISQFVTLYRVVGKVDVSPIKNLEGGVNYRQFKLEYSEMKKISTSLNEMAVLVGGSAVAGAAAVGGAMGLAALIGTASTGTAIGSLSGVAATNATLAWLGGGTVSAGGAGVAGGMIVLGGIALAPLAVFGLFLGANKGTQKLNAAKDYSDEIDVLVEKIYTFLNP